jgi:tetratricopeptide (TPR) repeat protein
VRAREAAQRALELDEHLGAAHAALGTVRFFLDWDFPGARKAFERAVELSPTDPAALNGLRGYLLLTLGKSSDADLLLERLLRVAPRDVYFGSQRMWHFFYTREYERGLAEVERIRALDSEFVDFGVVALYLLLGRPEDAVREMLAFLVRAGAGFEPFRGAFERGSEEGGWEGGARSVIRLMIKAATRGASGLANPIAQQLAQIGETEEAMTWLERACEERDPPLLFAKIDPMMDSLRSDPRFQDLLRRIGFPED